MPETARDREPERRPHILSPEPHPEKEHFRMAHYQSIHQLGAVRP